MGYPTLPNKYQFSSFTNASHYISKLYPNLKNNLLAKNIFPETLLMTYDGEILKQIIRKNKVKKMNLFNGESYFLPKLGKYAITGNFGIGAPSIVSLLELYIALGIKNFYTIGYAGALSSDLSLNEIVLCKQAIPDDGVTQHYLGDVDMVEARPKSITLIQERAKKRKISIKTCNIWSTSAIFRETVNEISHFRDQGISAVDMESAAVLALAKVYDINVGIFLIISDKIKKNDWTFVKGDNDVKNQKIKDIVQLCQMD